MTIENLATARDVAVLILALQVFVLLLIPGAVAYFSFRGTRYVAVRARGAMRQGRAKVDVGLGYVRAGMGYVAAPFLWLVATIEGLRRGALAVRRAFGGGRLP